MTALAIAGLYQPFVRSVNTGSSPESKQVEQIFAQAVGHFRSIPERERAFGELITAVTGASTENWDSYHARAASLQAAAVAARLLTVLPLTLPAPDVGIDPDGEISFEWILSRDRMFSVSVAENGRLSYAGIFGKDVSSHGTEPFYDTIPGIILENIMRLGIED